MQPPSLFVASQSAWNGSEAALITLKNCLAAGWARDGIESNLISPEYVDTTLAEGGGNAWMRDIVAARDPTGRMGAPNEVTGAVVMSLSTTSMCKNGTDIAVDGGASAF